MDIKAPSVLSYFLSATSLYSQLMLVVFVTVVINFLEKSNTLRPLFKYSGYNIPDKDYTASVPQNQRKTSIISALIISRIIAIYWCINLLGDYNFSFNF
jgi:hypothetical protein